MATCECGCGRETRLEAANRRDEGRLKGEPRRFIHGHNTRRAATVSYRLIPWPHGQWRLAHLEMRHPRPVVEPQGATP
jgi:hypothetical protein